jgi:hypothetical protein
LCDRHAYPRKGWAVKQPARAARTKQGRGAETSTGAHADTGRPERLMCVKCGKRPAVPAFVRRCPNSAKCSRCINQRRSPESLERHRARDREWRRKRYQTDGAFREMAKNNSRRARITGGNGVCTVEGCDNPRWRSSKGLFASWCHFHVRSKARQWQIANPEVKRERDRRRYGRKLLALVPELKRQLEELRLEEQAVIRELRRNRES